MSSFITSQKIKGFLSLFKDPICVIENFLSNDNFPASRKSSGSKPLVITIGSIPEIRKKSLAQLLLTVTITSASFSTFFSNRLCFLSAQ